MRYVQRIFIGKLYKNRNVVYYIFIQIVRYLIDYTHMLFTGWEIRTGKCFALNKYFTQKALNSMALNFPHISLILFN